MAEGNMFMVFIILGSVSDNFHCQLCNLGMDDRNETDISTVYTFTDESYSDSPNLTADKALDGNYYPHYLHCSGSKTSTDPAWWRVTLNSLSRIFKINLVFREKFTRHCGYKVFVTNDTVKVTKLNDLKLVYHDTFERTEVSQQNTIVFPEGIFGLQFYVYVNFTEGGHIFIDLCEAEIYGCVLRQENVECNCNSLKMLERKKDPVLQDSKVSFETGRVSLRCDLYRLSIMNLTGGKYSLLKSIMQICDGKHQCTINSTDALQNESISFYCVEGCLNEDYNNSFYIYNTAEDSHAEYRSDERDFTAFTKSRVFNCSDRYVLTDGNLTRQCQLGGRWSGTAPVCNVTCREPVHENSTTIRNTIPAALYFEDYNVSYACRKNYLQANGSLVRVCNSSGDWTGEEPICKHWTKRDNNMPCGKISLENMGCQCPCYRLKSQHFITDPKELENRIEELKRELEVNQETLAATIRKKTCAKDERKSSAAIGSALGVGIITFVLSIIFCSDIPILYRHIRYGPDADHHD